MSEQKYDLIIDGASVPTVDHFPVINPATGETVGLCPDATRDQLDSAVDAARAAHLKWKKVPDEERKAACLAIADAIDAHAEELALLVTLEQGKPLNGLGSRFELGGCAAWARYTAGLELPVEVIQDDEQGRVELHRHPVGVVGSITPWNWPLSIVMWHMLPAIRTGSGVVIKPSPLTPLSTIRLVEVINSVLPKGVVNVVSGGNELGQWMSEHPGINKMVFTGSSATGRKIMASSAATLKRLTLELGGNDAGIVLPDADPKAIVEGLFWGAFINNGQTCAALKRLYVPDTLHDAIAAELVTFASKIKVGNGLEEDTILGPVQNAMQFAKVKELVDDAVAQGATVLMGGNPDPDQPGYFYPVTILTDVTDGMRVVDEEQFGPVLPIIRYSSVEDALARANASENGLGGSVWSPDKEKAKALALQLECGSAWINAHGMVQPNVPFGGVKSSGIGVEFGTEGLKEYTTVQSLFAG
ncbi:MAG: aldehyde dehydrogenase family protein [Sphingobium sp.]